MTAPALTATTQKDLPNHRTDLSEDQVAQSRICRDLYGGTQSMRDAGQRYLPKAKDEIAADYSARKGRSYLFNGLKRTVGGLAGMVFREDPVLSDDVPAPVVSAWEDIDLAGTNGDVFLRQTFEFGVLDGHCGILVDAPIVEAGRPLTLADEEQMGIRPYWTIIRLEDIMSWRWQRLGGEVVLTQLVLRSVENRPHGAFGMIDVTVYRVYALTVSGEGAIQVGWQEWEQTDAIDEPMPTRSGTIANIDRIPLAVFYADKRGVLESAPPLLDLADLNVAHWQVASDHSWGLHMASVPTGVLTGVDSDSPFARGVNTWIKIPDPQGKAEYLEHSGASFTATRQEKEDLKAEMAAVGLGMLVRETRAAETAEAKRMDKGEQDSKLAVMARSLQDAVESALGFHARMIGLDEGGSVDITRNFDTEQIDAGQVDQLRGMVKDKQLSLETMWQILQTRDFLPDGVVFEDETARIAEESEQNQARAATMFPPSPNEPEAPEGTE